MPQSMSHIKVNYDAEITTRLSWEKKDISEKPNNILIHIDFIKCKNNAENLTLCKKHIMNKIKLTK